MGADIQSPKPLLIVVAGRPGSGKTSLAHALARAIRCPVISRDEIKEGIVNTMEGNEDLSGEIARRAYEAFFDTIQLLLSRGVTVVAEAAFQHSRWAPKLEPLMEFARLRIVLCSLDPELARFRRIERCASDPVRERFHPDEAVRAARDGQEFSMEEYDPPHLDAPIFTVDTTDGYLPDFEAVVSFASA